MQDLLLNECIGVVAAPLIGAIVCGFGGKLIGPKNTHRVAISAVAISFVLSVLVARQLIFDPQGPQTLNVTLYNWAMVGPLQFQVGFMIDALSVLMMGVVTFVSLMVHIYTMGYMQGDPGYQRFFSYINLFTFAMLMLVMANNFLQLFFGWEAVGLVSYLLIGFWYKKETATFANLKAFLVNRVGDFGFLLGIAGVLMVFGTLNYEQVFAQVSTFESLHVNWLFGHSISAMTIICIALFIGAMGKSAQVPLHVWLPDSMEGPTPISALIHAATMVTAGVFMVTRMSPLFETSQVALNFVLTIGAITCFFMGLLGIVSDDIKRIIAYSTLSQLGYMVTALGVSAYSIGMFHLMTHAFFKALLFLGAGSVIMAMHHEQNIFKMGALRKQVPITYWTMLIGSLALIGFPFFSGFYSKDLIIEAVAQSQLPFAKWAYWAVLGSVFVTAFYSFRLFFVVFHTQYRNQEMAFEKVKEPSWVVWLPLVCLAIPSIFAGAYFIGPIFEGYFADSIVVSHLHTAMAYLQGHFHGAIPMATHGFSAPPFWLAMGGVFSAWVAYVAFPKLPAILKTLLKPLHALLIHKYGFDAFNQVIIAPATRGIGWLFWRLGDRVIIDGAVVNGSAKSIGMFARVIRHLQTGYIYHYAFAMITGLIVFLLWWTLR